VLCREGIEQRRGSGEPRSVPRVGVSPATGGTDSEPRVLNSERSERVRFPRHPKWKYPSRGISILPRAKRGATLLYYPVLPNPRGGIFAAERSNVIGYQKKSASK
jgi:hypothetical protein